MGLPGGKRRKETLHSKASESAAHVAGFGLHLEGFSPPNLPEGFFDSLLLLLSIFHDRGKAPEKQFYFPAHSPLSEPSTDCAQLSKPSGFRS